MLGCREFPRQREKPKIDSRWREKIEKKVSCRDQTKKTGGWKSGLTPDEPWSEVR